jgi:APA family basic amino acid/polyamine antiporter
MATGQEAITETMLYLAPFFQISTTVRYCRNAARGIVSAVRERHANLLILGWHGGRHSRGFAMGSTLDPIIERCCCDVAVFKNCGGDKYKRILVPVAGGPNSAFALEMAAILADPNEGQVTAFNVVSPSAGRSFDIDKFVSECSSRMAIDRSRIHTRTVDGADPVASIIGEADADTPGYDLVVLGGTREPILAQFTRASVPEKVARQCDKPLVMVQMSRGIRSWVRRWI